MTYATQADLETRFGVDYLAQLTDRVDGSVIDTVVIARAITDAEAEIDSYLAMRYQLPLTTLPLVLNRLACDIARFRLHDSAPEPVRKLYEDAVRDLKSIAAGSRAIDGVAPLAPASALNGASVTSPSRSKVFGGALQ